MLELQPDPDLMESWVPIPGSVGKGHKPGGNRLNRFRMWERNQMAERGNSGSFWGVTTCTSGPGCPLGLSDLLVAVLPS